MSETRRILFDQALLDDRLASNVLVEVADNGVVVAVTAGADETALPRHGGIAVPGMGNVHSHAFQRLMAGLAEVATGDGDSFWTWRELMYRTANRLGPDELEAVARHLYIQMLEAGWTSVAEFHYLHHQRRGEPFDDPAEMSLRLVAAAESVGMGITLLPTLYQRAGFDGAELEPRQRRFFHTTDRFLALLDALESKRSDNVEVGLGIHSLRAANVSTINEVLLGAPPERPRHIHVAEQPREVTDCMEMMGARPVELLADKVGINELWTLVHATHVSREEIAVITEAEALVGLCPTTEANLGDGLFPLAEYLAANGRFGVGTDSHVAISPAAELRWLEYGQRLKSGRRCVVVDQRGDVASTLWRSAARGARRACGRPIGAIEVGRRADIVVIDSVHDADPRRLLQRHLFGAGLTHVHSVFVGGRQVVEGGHHPDRESAALGFADVAARLL